MRAWRCMAISSRSILVVDELTGYQPEKKPGRVDPEKVQVPAPVQAKVQERPQAFEATLRFRGDKVIAAKVPLEHFATDLRLHQGRLALTPTFQLAGGTVQAQAQVDTQANSAAAARYAPRCTSSTSNSS